VRTRDGNEATRAHVVERIHHELFTSVIVDPFVIEM